MTATLYGEEIVLAQQLLAESGAPAVVSTTTQSVDPITELPSQIATVEAPTSVVFVKRKRDRRPVPGTNSAMVSESASLLIAAGDLPFLLTGGERVTVNGEVWILGKLDVIAPDGTPILYTAEATR